MKILETKNYEIKVGDIKEELVRFFEGEDFSQICVIVDENTKRDCLPIIEKYLGKKLQFIEIKSGEENKNITTCQHIWSEMMSMKLGRNSLVIDLGGGVIGDMGGFCASTFKRGMRFVQIPTTLLSQVDASVGGKLGIDFLGVKNSVGVFNDPQSVFIDSLFLKTLPKREIRSGFAEIIKHALIADQKEWKGLVQINDLDGVDWSELIYRSVQVKQHIVVEDPFEKGIRKALNFGHTIGHAIESVFLETSSPLLHGEAIAIGMICEAYISHKKANLSKNSLEEIVSFFLRIYGKIILDPKDFPRMLDIMGNDKKNIGKEINFSLIPEIGSVLVNQTAGENLIVESLEYYQIQ